MGIKKTHVHWTTTEERILREKWTTTEMIKEFLPLLSPGRTYQSVIAHAANMALGPRPIKIRSKYSAVWDDVERLLKVKMQLTAKEIAERTGFSARHITDLLQAKLREDEPKVHVPSWRRRGRAHGYVEVWSLGEGQNVRKPKAASRDEMNRRRREKRAKHKLADASGPFAVAVGQVLREAA